MEWAVSDWRVSRLAAIVLAAGFVVLGPIPAAVGDDGSRREESLQAVLERMEEGEGLRLAKQALDAGEPSPATLGAVMNAIGQYTSDEALDFVRERALLLSNERNLDDFDHVARVWAGMYLRRHGGGEAGYSAAAREVADGRLSAYDRALRLRVFAAVGRGDDTPAREVALDVYRPFLEHPDVELRIAALSVNSALWDWEVISRLQALADAPRDPWLRSKARGLAGRYLMAGPDRPRPGQSVLSPSWRSRHEQPWDPDGYREWLRHTEEWNAQQRRLESGESPPSR